MRDLTLRAVDTKASFTFTKASLGFLLLFMCFCVPTNVCQANDARFNICWATNVAAAVPQMLNIVSCDVERWNMPFNISWNENRAWLYSVQRTNATTTTTTITFIQVAKMFNICWSVKGNEVEPCIIRFINLFMEFDFYCSFLLPLLQLLNRVPCPLHLCDETKIAVMLFSAKCLTCIHRVT